MPEQVSEPEAAAGAEVEPAADGQPKRKRSRRGTRGGRKRKKPATNGTAGEDALTEAIEDVAVAVAVAEPAKAVAEPAKTVDTPGAAVDESPPAEYVPMSEWIEDFDSRSRGR